MRRAPWITIRQPLSGRRRRILTAGSFLLPMALWAALSYLPFLWHPFVKITAPGAVDYFTAGMTVERETFEKERADAVAARRAAPQGEAANPVYLPAPHEVAVALVEAFRTPPRLPSEPWLHQSLWHSLQVILWGFLLSSVLGVPLGILAGTVPLVSRLTEPFVEFFRYLPAPAFGALCVAILGIYDAPKIAIIFIGTFFQQVLVVANTTRKLDPSLLEAAQTLGASRRQLLMNVVVPGIIVDLYTDTRVLLGWAWTYLIVAELVGTTSGITYFINQQARYRNYPNVYAAIILIGFIGLFSDLLLGALGARLFPWQPRVRRSPLPALGRTRRTAGEPAAAAALEATS